MAIKDREFRFENYQEYFGDHHQVKKIINRCKACGCRVVHTHLTDYTNLVVQENTKCPECGEDERKVIHIIN